MNQPQTLFDAGPTDPMWRPGQETSRAAARTVELGNREREIVDVLRYGVTSMTVADIQAELASRTMHRERANIARRLTSLERKGIVQRVGVELAAHGVTRTTWRLLP